MIRQTRFKADRSENLSCSLYLPLSLSRAFSPCRNFVLSRLPYRFPFLPRSLSGRAIDFAFILGDSLALLASKHRKGRGRVAALAARSQIPMLRGDHASRDNARESARNEGTRLNRCSSTCSARPAPKCVRY